MMDEKFYEELKEKVKEIIQEGDGGHDLDHLLRVYNNALLLSKGEL
ncbi:MAG: phosphohydrolase, partial [Candidatus Magasanikbacteria bacterium]|nr:phosphohydrolase [Candidatus Magasanikbacteria bacterium]